MPHDDPPPLVMRAGTQPEPAPTPPPREADKTDEEIFGEAAVMLRQLKRDRETAQQREQQLQVELTEALLARQGDGKKVDFLELENAELRNNIATLQSQIEDYRTFMSRMKEILDRFGIKASEKKRNGNGNGNGKKKKLPSVGLPPEPPVEIKD
jgi:hypothetical protein